MIKNNFFGLKYCTWNIDHEAFLNFKRNSNFDKALAMLYMEAYLNAKKAEVSNDYSMGLAYSIRANVLDKLPEFDEFGKLIHDNLTEAINFFGVEFESSRIVKSWANRMHKDSSGVVHNHVSFDSDKNLNSSTKFVLLVYYKIPVNSANLVFLNPDKYLKEPDFKNDRFDKQEFLSEDILTIQPTEGMCILHDAKIPHTVSVHNSHKPRDVLIFDYE